jgi:hypothetical protein
MSVAKEQVAEALAVAEAEIHGGAVTLPPHLVARANQARINSEALATLKKVVEADKKAFEDVLNAYGVREGRDASGRRVVLLNSRAPMTLDQRELRALYPEQAEACTHPNPYDYISFG